MEITSLIPHIEALIFASDKPLTSLEITELVNNAFGFMEDKITLDQVETSMEGIIEKYQSEFYPFEVRQSGGGWQFLTKKDYHKTVAQLNGDKFLKRLSNAALESLAIIAYKQPITKGEIEAIRGVNTDYSIQKLLEKELIVISGRNEALPGKPLIYATSRNFMDYFGINSPEDLPRIKEVLADQIVEPTYINQETPQEVFTEAVAEAAVEAAADQEPAVEEIALMVAENGELLEQSLPEAEHQPGPADDTIAENNDNGADEPRTTDTATDEEENPAV
jgi:segregation and condensation protein B